MEEELEKLDKRNNLLVPLHPLSYIGINKYFNYKLSFNGIYFKEKIYLAQKIERMSSISIIKKIKEDTEFRYLLTKTRLYALILLKHYAKPKINLSHTTYSE